MQTYAVVPENLCRRFLVKNAIEQKNIAMYHKLMVIK